MDMNEKICRAMADATGLRAEIDEDEAVIIADAAFEKKVSDAEVADFLSLHRRQSILAALRAAHEDLGDPEIAGNGDHGKDRAAIKATIDDGLRSLATLKAGLSQKANEVLDAHMRRIHTNLAPRLKLQCRHGKLTGILVSVFVKSISAGTVIVTENSPESVARGVRKIINHIAPGLAA